MGRDHLCCPEFLEGWVEYSYYLELCHRDNCQFRYVIQCLELELRTEKPFGIGSVWKAKVGKVGAKDMVPVGIRCWRG